ncbi:MAG: (2Fe-2S)-binding protein, partial [Acidimicrobiia bacterium]
MAADTRGTWLSLGEQCEPSQLRPALVRIGVVMGTDDLAVVGSVVGRDLLAALTSLTVAGWCRERVVLDVTRDNVLVDLTQRQPRLALRRDVGVSGPDVIDQLEAWLIDDAAACYIDGLRAVVRTGTRHLWGNVALAVVNTLAALSHDAGNTADTDRRALLARRPELATALDIVSTSDEHGDELTFAIRRNCCLIFKVPGMGQCGTCSLRPRDDRI